jgi:AcrR family transcriptional regulator
VTRAAGATRPITRRAGEDLLSGEIARPEPGPARGRRVAEIVAAARHILESESRDALTMRRLAEELGIQAPSLYKHFSGKAAVEAELIADALSDVGEVTHRALHRPTAGSRLMSVLTTYRAHCLANATLYRLATSGHLDRELLPAGLEEWAGNPWYVVTGDPALAQALWSFAHGMVTLELDGRYPPGSDLDATWRAGATAFERAAR